MARPVRCRRICSEPEYDRFVPCGRESTEQVLLTVDEYEAVRLTGHGCSVFPEVSMSSATALRR